MRSAESPSKELMDASNPVSKRFRGIYLQHHFCSHLQSLFDLATKPCSVAFDAYRDESYVNGGEDYLTFSGCTVNIGNGMCPKTGEFTCPEPGIV